MKRFKTSKTVELINAILAQMEKEYEARGGDCLHRRAE